MIFSRRRSGRFGAGGRWGVSGFNPLVALDVVFVHRGQSLRGSLADLALVDSWPDEGEGTHTGTAILTERPVFHAAGGPNDLPYLTFDGNDQMPIAVVNEAQPLTFFFVIRRGAGGGNQIIVNGTGNREQIWLAGGQPAIFAGGVVQGGVTSQDWDVVTVTFNGAASNAWVRHVQVITNGNPGANGLSQALYGSDGSNHMNADLEEAWCVRGAVADPTLSDMIDYLLTRCAIV